jgi:radical SAM-linked protein
MRLRITFSKTDAMQYSSHLDLQRAWERTIRRAGLPLAYSQGFNQRPRLQLALALPLGLTSKCELLDAWFETEVDPLVVRTALDRAAPPGLKVLAVLAVDPKAPALQTQVRSAGYEVILLDLVPDLRNRLEGLLSATELPRERRGKPYDLRPLIEALAELEPDGAGRARLSMQLAAREGQTGRPEEVLLALGIPPEAARIRRTSLVMEDSKSPATPTASPDPGAKTWD